jgi:hypothetical protein
MGFNTQIGRFVVEDQFHTAIGKVLLITRLTNFPGQYN